MMPFTPHNRHRSRPSRRRGLVLIFVVVILALLAVMVTAYLASVRLDAAPMDAKIGGPVGAGQADFGLRDTATLDAQFITLVSRVQQTLINDLFNTGTPSAANYRAPGYQPWTGFNPNLGDSKNAWLASSVPTETSAGSGIPNWRYISRWMGPATTFDDPRSALGASIAYTNVENLQPTAFPITYDYAGNDRDRHRLYPAFLTGAGVRIAADTDGDGIADAGLFYTGTYTADPDQGNIYYYGAVRIVDNAAMVNLNTAWQRGVDVDIASGSSTYNQGFFLANVGLYELLLPTFQGDPNANNTDILALVRTRLSNNTTLYTTPFNDNGAARPDFTFTTWAEAFDTQLGRRLANPGRRDNNSSFFSLLGGNIPALHYRATFVNPNEAPSTVELALGNSLYRSAANFAELSDRIFTFYPAGVMDGIGTPDADLTRWFHDNYHVGQTTAPNTAPNLRAYTTAFNPVSNAITRHYWSGNTLVAGMPAYAPGLPVKASVNTSDFATLWRAYWNVMCDDAQADATQPANATMFDSPLRGGTPLSPRQVQLLRAALAAVNTEDLRDGNLNVSSRTVTLPADSGSPERIATVYGQTWHPWITEVLIDRDGPKDYIAIELYNPYPQALSLYNYKLAAFDRGAGTLTDLPLSSPFGVGDTIPADGYIVLHLQANQPADVSIAGGVQSYNVPALAVGQEIVLLRPRLANGNLSVGTDPQGGVYNENLLTDLVPVDQADLTVPAVSTNHRRWHYERTTEDWQFVYPGRLTPGGATVMELNEDSGGYTPGSLGADNANPSFLPSTIQVSNVDMPGPHRMNASGNQFPFGGFARNGDILAVPYFGAYRLVDIVGGPITELTSASFDTAYMKLGTPGENIGRFCPDPTNLTNGYQWATKLFDYLSVHSPAADFLPNVNPTAYQNAGAPVPQPVPNAAGVSVSSANTTAENLVPTQGLINVNTAPWEVIAMLPMVPNNAAANQALAQAIVDYREANGPFKNLFELNKVPGFKTPAGMPANPGLNWGDLSPDTVVDDFENQYLTLNRISNLATVRSDTFTCYVLVQAWQVQLNATGTPPRLIGERRAAFIVDRSTITPDNRLIKDLNVIGVPVQ